MKHPWPFKSPLVNAPAPAADLLDDEPEEASPFCLCDNLPRSEEVAANKCAACGKQLK